MTEQEFDVMLDNLAEFFGLLSSNLTDADFAIFLENLQISFNAKNAEDYLIFVLNINNLMVSIKNLLKPT